MLNNLYLVELICVHTYNNPHYQMLIVTTVGNTWNIYKMRIGFQYPSIPVVILTCARKTLQGTLNPIYNSLKHLM